MKLTIVGCAGSFPGPESSASCYLLEAPWQGGTFRLLLDIGSGSFGTLQHYIDPKDIDAISLSHLHPDHCFDISGLYVYRKYHPSGLLPRIPVFSPSGSDWHLSNAYGTTQPNGMTLPFEFRDHLDGGEVQVGPFTLTAKKVVHPVPAYAVRVTDGENTIVYSGDTGPMDGLADFVRGADIFLCEASFTEDGENPPDLHLTGAEAGQIAEDAQVPLLLVTHIPSWTDRDIIDTEVRTTYTGEHHLVRAGETYDV